MPDFASRNEASTSWALLPIEDTMPMPVTTTRLMTSSLAHVRMLLVPGARRSRTGGSFIARLAQADSQILGGIDRIAVGFKPAVAGAKSKFPPDHPLQLDDIFQLLHGRQHHAGEFDLANAERTPLPRSPEPAEEKTQKLPQGVEPEAARHHRIALEVTGEKPQVRLHVELGDDAAIAVLAALLLNLRDAVEHQHGRQRQLRVAWAEQLAPRASEQVLVIELFATLDHPRSFLA